MNIAVIFAGGRGTRMHSKELPKQFLLMHGKPIIAHTIEVFQQSDEIDAIVIACITNWIDHLKSIIEQYNYTKVKKIVPGGDTGQTSIYNGLKVAKIIAKDALCPLTLLNLIQIYFDYIYKINLVGMTLKLYRIFTLFNHIWLGLFIFLLLKNIVLSKKHYKPIEIKLLNKTDLYSYDGYLTHQFFILGPFSLMKLTSNNLFNIVIALFCIIISAYGVHFISEKLIQWWRMNVEFCEREIER